MRNILWQDQAAAAEAADLEAAPSAEEGAEAPAALAADITDITAITDITGIFITDLCSFRSSARDIIGEADFSASFLLLSYS